MHASLCQLTTYSGTLFVPHRPSHAHAHARTHACPLARQNIRFDIRWMGEVDQLVIGKFLCYPPSPFPSPSCSRLPPPSSHALAPPSLAPATLSCTRSPLPPSRVSPVPSCTPTAISHTRPTISCPSRPLWSSRDHLAPSCPRPAILSPCTTLSRAHTAISPTCGHLVCPRHRRKHQRHDLMPRYHHDMPLPPSLTPATTVSSHCCHLSPLLHRLAPRRCPRLPSSPSLALVTLACPR
ncbi:hypothetical protein EVG20_g11601, partial [Dentipellis fragilis]